MNVAGLRARAASQARAMPGTLRRHWLLAILLAAGLALRVLAQIAYRPALLYIDTTKYLYNAYPGGDPVGYKAPLRLILALGNLETVTAVQHLLGLGMAVTCYVILVRLGTWRWLAALAAAPVLLDAYQVQIEQTIMPDVWFEAVIVAAIAVLLIRPAGASGLRMRSVVAAGLLLGASATVRQVGEILIFPALLYLLALGGGWYKVVSRWLVMGVAFAVPIAGYMAGSLVISGHAWLSNATPSLTSYGRMASAADCATLRIPAYERPLCPTARQRGYGIDWLDHDIASPLKSYVAPAGMNRYAVISSFDRTVMLQQPQRVLAAIALDGAHLFGVTRTATQDGTPISRWQFQQSYPSYGNWIMVSRSGVITFGLRLTPGDPTITRVTLSGSYGGTAQVSKPAAGFLRAYQLGGGYTPGPLLAVLALAGLAGSALTLLRRDRAGSLPFALGCLLFFASGVFVLLISDAFQFTWRYQLPALITLPPAGVLGIMAVARAVRGRSPAAAEPAAAEPALAKAGEEVALKD